MNILEGTIANVWRVLIPNSSEIRWNCLEWGPCQVKTVYAYEGICKWLERTHEHVADTITVFWNNYGVWQRSRFVFICSFFFDDVHSWQMFHNPGWLMFQLRRYNSPTAFEVCTHRSMIHLHPSLLLDWTHLCFCPCAQQACWITSRRLQATWRRIWQAVTLLASGK